MKTALAGSEKREDSTSSPRTGAQNAATALSLLLALILGSGVVLSILFVAAMGDAVTAVTVIGLAFVGVTTILVGVISMLLRTWWWLIFTTAFFVILAALVFVYPERDDVLVGWLVRMGLFAIGNILVVTLGAWIGHRRIEKRSRRPVGEHSGPIFKW